MNCADSFICASQNVLLFLEYRYKEYKHCSLLRIEYEDWWSKPCVTRSHQSLWRERGAKSDGNEWMVSNQILTNWIPSVNNRDFKSLDKMICSDWFDERSNWHNCSNDRGVLVTRTIELKKIVIVQGWVMIWRVLVRSLNLTILKTNHRYIFIILS